MTQTMQFNYAALILRLALGSMYLAHGLMKLWVFTPTGTYQFFASLGVPGFLGPLVMSVEVLGGLALIAGFHSRWIAVGLMPVLAGAIILVHGGNGWAFANTGGGWEFCAFLLMASASQFLLGDGAYSLRAWLKAKPMDNAAETPAFSR